MNKPTQLLIALCLLPVISISTACSKDHSKPGHEIKIITDMIYPVPSEAFSENKAFKNGRTMQDPVAGTIARGTYIPAKGVQNPLEVTEHNIQRGRHVYRTTCMVCHGVFGAGDGPIIPRFPNPPSLTSDRIKALSASDLHDVITKGKGNMASYAGQVAADDRWKVVMYIQNELQKQ